MQEVLGWQELILLKKHVVDFENTTDPVVFELPGLTNDMKVLELREIKIGVAAPDVASPDLEWLGIEIMSPKGGLLTPNGNVITIVPEFISAGTILFKEFHKNNVVLLELNTKNATQYSCSLKLQFLKGSNQALAKRYVYLRLGLRQANHMSLYAPRSGYPDDDRFQAL